jgi:DNA polymerase-3 subunit delta'
LSAFLFLGEDERRVEEVLRQRAKALLCLGDGEGGACLSCHSFERGNHPDLLLIRPEGKTGIEAVRSVQAFFFLPPLRSSKKVAAFPAAENLTPQAQAALLKTLEDPPPYGVILLSARREGSLLPTLVSRCLRIRVSGGFLSGEGEFLEAARRVASLCVGGQPFPLLSREAESLARKIPR